MKRRKHILIWILAIPVILLAGLAWVIWGGLSNPADRKVIGEITPPVGFQRVEVAPGSFGEFIRDFPLQGRGMTAASHTVSTSGMQFLTFP